MTGIFIINDFVVVFGPGPIGLISAMAAKTEGAREVDFSNREYANGRLKKEVGCSRGKLF